MEHKHEKSFFKQQTIINIQKSYCTQHIKLYLEFIKKKEKGADGRY